MEVIQLEPIAQEGLPEEVELETVSLEPPTVELEGSSIVSGTEDSSTSLTQQPERNWVETVPLTDQELDLLAKKHGVDRAELESFAAARGGITPYKDVPTELMEAGKQALGQVGEAVLFGLPQKLVQKMQTPKMEAAIEDLRDLIDSKKSRFQQGAELTSELAAGIAMPAAALGKAGTIGATLSAGAIEGGLTGYAHSKAGEELGSTAVGAGVGMAFGGVVHGALKGLTHLAGRKAPEQLDKAVTEMLGEETPAVYKLMDEELDAYLPEAANKVRMIETLKDIPEAELGKVDFNKLIKEMVDSSEEELMARAGKIETRSEDILKDLVDREGRRAEANMPELRRRADAIAEKQIVDEEASELRQFGYYLKFGKPYEGTDVTKATPGILPKSADGEVLSLLKNKTTKEIEEDLLHYKTFSMLMDDSNVLSKRIRELEGYEADGITRLINSFRDGRYTASSIDRKHFGMKMAPTLDEGSIAQKAHTLYITARLEEAKELNKLLTKEKGWEGLSYKIIQQIENPSEKAEPKVKELAEKYAGTFKTWLKEFNDKAVELNGKKIIVGERQNYVLHTMMSYVDSMARLNNTIRELQEKGVDILDSDLSIKALLNKAELAGVSEKADQLVRAVTLLNSGEQKHLKDLAYLSDFTKQFKELRGGVNRGKVEDIIARSSLAREGDIPLIIREVRLPLLMERWAINTSRAMHLQKTMASLREARNKLVAVQDIPSAEWAQRLIEDLSGGNQSSLSSAINKRTERIQVEFRTAAQATDNPLKKAFYQFVSETPEYANFLIQGLYSVYLGLPKLTPVITNMSTIFTYSVPELGYKYGTPLALKAYQKALQKVGSKDFKVAKYLEEAGFKGAEVTRLGELLHNETISSDMARSVMEKVKKGNNALMFAFEMSENFNKLVSLEMADKVALDVWGGSKSAADFLKRVQPGTKRVLKELVDKNDFEGFRKEMRKYFIGKMILNYDKVNMAQIGREIGPMLSMFSKWPATMAGDVIEQFETKGKVSGSLEIARKLMLPVFIGAALNLATEDIKDNVIVNSLKGKGKAGFERYAPIASLGGLATGKFASAPALVPVSAAISAVSGDVEGASKQLKNFVDDVAMGVVVPVRLVRMLGEMASDE